MYISTLIFLTFLYLLHARTGLISDRCSKTIGDLGRFYKCAGPDNIALLGKGSNGVVFLVTSLKTDQKSVLKVSEPSPQLLMSEAHDIHDVLKNERYIAKRYFRKVVGERLYEIIEYGSQGPLSKIVGRFDLEKDQKQIIELFGKIVEGIEVMHNHGFIHADIKPDNVVLTANNEPRIIDFDVSVFKNKRARARGTLPYAAPEVLSKLKTTRTIKFTEKQDAWSLGVLLYVMLFGMTPLNIKNHGSALQMVSIRENMRESLLKFYQDGEFIIPKSASNEAISILEMLLKTRPSERADLADVKMKINDILDIDDWHNRDKDSIMRAHEKGYKAEFGRILNSDNFPYFVFGSSSVVFSAIVCIVIYKTSERRKSRSNT